MEKLVSVVIPTYNREHTIVRAIQSVLNQTYKTLEILIIDDNSTDNTEKVIQGFKDDRMKYLRHTCNMGGSAARNSGIRIAKGEYIAFLDSDDEWLPEKIEKQLNIFFKSDDTVGVVYTGFYVVNEYGEIHNQMIPNERGSLFSKLLVGNCVGTTSIILAKTCYLRRIEGFDETLPSCQDWDLYLRLSEICTFEFNVEPLVKYSRSKNLESISNKKWAVIAGHNKVLDKYKINKLPKGIRANHYYYRGLIFLYDIDDKRYAFFNFFTAFCFTLRIKYLKGILLIFRKMVWKV
ncbi:MAG: glycosyltransferase family 2 protein [Planctomycetia bacterium]|nr:glycosyltransferase family 2 protein [Planctomycetia bacterium]